MVTKARDLIRLCGGVLAFVYGLHCCGGVQAQTGSPGQPRTAADCQVLALENSGSGAEVLVKNANPAEKRKPPTEQLPPPKPSKRSDPGAIAEGAVKEATA